MREAASGEGLQTPRPRKANGAGGQERAQSAAMLSTSTTRAEPERAPRAPRAGVSWGGRHGRSYCVCSADMFRMKA